MKIKSLAKPQHFVFLSLLLFLIVFASSAFAIGKPSDVGGNPTGVQQERRQQAQNRLTEAKLKACQAKENAIKKRSEHLGQLVSTMMEKFDAIAKRVEEYYTTKVVPSGKTIANYDSLVSDIQTKKGAVQTALATAQSDAGSFACDGNDPKGQLLQFREDMRAVKSALKGYRTSIKNLIVAVRSVTGTTQGSNPASPTP